MHSGNIQQWENVSLNNQMSSEFFSLLWQESYNKRFSCCFSLVLHIFMIIRDNQSSYPNLMLWHMQCITFKNSDIKMLNELPSIKYAQHFCLLQVFDILSLFIFSLPLQHISWPCSGRKCFHISFPSKLYHFSWGLWGQSYLTVLKIFTCPIEQAYWTPPPPPWVLFILINDLRKQNKKFLM